MIEVDENILLMALQEGLFEEPHWQTFLERLRLSTQADYVSLAFRRPGARVDDVRIVHAGTAQTDPAQTRLGPDVLEGLYRRTLPHFSLTPGQVYGTRQLRDVDVANGSDHAQQYMALRGMRHSRVVRIVSADGANAWLTASRKGTDFGPDAAATLARLAPHIAMSIRALALVEKERMRAGIAADVARRLNFGWLAFDAGGQVLEMDAQAQAVLGALAPFARTAAGCPFAAPVKVKNRLMEVLAAFAEQPVSPPRALHLSDDPWLDFLIVPVSDRALSSATIPVAVAYVHGTGAAHADRCDQLIDLFALSRNEASLALALSNGQSIAEAADKLGLTRETARNYSKRIYAKTGTRGQVDLVRLILASVVALT